MAKLNISLNNTNYQIDESALSTATAELRTHLSTTMNGTGATINLGEVAYNIDSAKLTSATNAFTSHLRAIAGSGSKVMVNGVEYPVDSAKLQAAMSALQTRFGNLSGGSTPDVPTEERLEGDGAEYYTMAPTALSFRSTAPLNELQDVQINGVTVDPSNYTLEEGSTIVTFPIDYLKTLDIGSYEVDIVSESKSVKGDFTVAAPELNEYGFYYDQPYAGYVGYFNTDMTAFMRDDGTLDLYVHSINLVETGNYVFNDNSLTITTPNFGTTIWAISTNGMEIANSDAGATLRIGGGDMVADADYIYTYNEEVGGYVLTRPFDKEKFSYGAIRTGINGIDTVAIANDAFLSCKNLASIVIPDSVTSIGDSAFNDCKCLKSITIPDSVTSIGHYAFDNNAIESIEVDINNTVYHSIDNCLIETETHTLIFGCKNSVIPDSVTSIGHHAFSDCLGLTSIIIPDSVTSISGFAFKYCPNLTDVLIGSGVTKIFGLVFDNCIKLTSVRFNGTINQWDAISKEPSWIGNSSITYVQCSDGQVPLV